MQALCGLHFLSHDKLQELALRYAGVLVSVFLSLIVFFAEAPSAARSVKFGYYAIFLFAVSGSALISFSTPSNAAKV